MVENFCSSVASYTINDECETTRSLRKGVTPIGLGEDPIANSGVEESELKLTNAATCQQCSDAQDCSNSDVTCPAKNNLCFTRRLLDGTVIEAGCAGGSLEILYDRGIDTIKQNTLLTLCSEPLCNEIGSEDQHLPNYECSSETISILLALLAVLILA